MTTINLYGEDGIAIYVDRYGDIVDVDNGAIHKVIGHGVSI